jgi:hypothetical protein
VGASDASAFGTAVPESVLSPLTVQPILSESFDSLSMYCAAGKVVV